MPLWMSLYSGKPLISPRAATDGGVCKNRLATRWMSSLVIFSENSKEIDQHVNGRFCHRIDSPMASMNCSGRLRVPVANT